MSHYFVLMRWFIQIAYRGTRYEGWQTQPHRRTVQDTLAKALSVLCREEIIPVGSGRTDAGVHALGQVAHFDTEEKLPENFLYAVNALLPDDLSVTHHFAVRENAHARYAAAYRWYRYCVHTRKNPLLHGASCYLPIYGRAVSEALNLTAMNRALRYVVGWRSFEAFSSGSQPTHAYCCVHDAVWMEDGTRLYFDVVANRFLRGMVRHMVGRLLALGLRRVSLADFIECLHSGKPKKGGKKASAEGLYLMKACYPRHIFLDTPPA